MEITRRGLRGRSHRHSRRRAPAARPGRRGAERHDTPDAGQIKQARLCAALEEELHLVAIGARQLQLVPAVEREEILAVHVRAQALHAPQIHDGGAVHALEELRVEVAPRAPSSCRAGCACCRRRGCTCSRPPHRSIRSPRSARARSRAPAGSAGSRSASAPSPCARAAAARPCTSSPEPVISAISPKSWSRWSTAVRARTRSRTRSSAAAKRASSTGFSR